MRIGTRRWSEAALCCALAIVLAGCAGRDPIVSSSITTPSGNWKIEKQTDRITGAPIASAYLMTRDASNSAVQFPQPAMMQLTCFKEQPIVRFSFEFKVGSNRNSVLGYRFDDKPGREIEARYLQDYRTVVIEDHASVAAFLNELPDSKSLYVRIRSLNAGRTAAEFQLDGAAAAIQAALSSCPLPPLTPAPQPGQRRKTS